MSERSDTLLRYAEVSSLGFGGLLLTLRISDPELRAELEEYRARAPRLRGQCFEDWNSCPASC